MTSLNYANQELENRRKATGIKKPVALGDIIGNINLTETAPVLESPIINGSPVTLDSLEITHPKLQTAVDAARKWQQRRTSQESAGETVNASLVLLATGLPGNINITGYGCGKTHIAKACLWSERFVMDGEPFAPAGTFYEAGRLIANLDGDTQPSAELRGGIVVIDDVGTEGTIPFVSKETQKHERESRYFKAINYAYEKGVSLILTANMAVNDFAEHIGGRAWSRLQEMAPTGLIVDLSGVPDYRRRQGGR